MNVFQPLVRENNFFLPNKSLIRKSHNLLSPNTTNPLVTMKGMKLSSFVPLINYTDLFPPISRSRLLNEWDINEWHNEMPFIKPKTIKAIEQETLNITAVSQSNSAVLGNDPTLLDTLNETENLSPVSDSSNPYIGFNSKDVNTQSPINTNFQAINSEKTVEESNEDIQIQRKTLGNSTDIILTNFLEEKALLDDRNPNLTSEIGSKTIASDATQITQVQKDSSTIINEIAETEEVTATHSLSDEPLLEDLVVNPDRSIRLSPNTQNPTTSDLTSLSEEENTSKSEISTKNNISDRHKNHPSQIVDNSTQSSRILENSSLLAQDDKSTISQKKEDIETKTVTSSLQTEISSELVNSISNTPLDVGSDRIIPQPIQTTPNLVESPASNLEDKSVAENQLGSATDFLSTQEKPDIPVENNSLLTELFDNRTEEKLPILQGFAVGGEVEVSANLANQQVASSDIIPAMLTPGEFVVNATDAQKNLNLLRHINSGGNAENLTQISAEPLTVQRKEENSTKVDIADNRAEEQNVDTSLATVFRSLNPSADLLNSKQKDISVLRSIQSDNLNNTASVESTSSTNYSSTPLIFRQKHSTPPQPSMNSNYDAIAQWSSVEDLLNFTHQDEHQDNFTSFNFTDLPLQSNNSQTPNVSEPTKNLVHQKSPMQYFAHGGEVTAPTQVTNTNIPFINETIEQSASNANDVNVPDLENLAREIYARLRQRLEIERERHGIYSGRLPW